MGTIVNGVDLDKVWPVIERFKPHPQHSELAIAAPDSGEGYWNGSCSAVEHNGSIYLAYRTRQPVALGRGQGVIVAKSADGVHFKTLQMISKDSMNAESLERPALIRTKDGKWRLYLSCATIGTKHWRIELLEADSPGTFDSTTRQVIMPGDANWAVKDPVIQYHDGLWHCWATFHPLDLKDQEDRMVSRYARSSDGITWQWSEGNCLEPPSTGWDKRGTRITAVYFSVDGIVAFYDGRATAAENFNEQTGVAVGTSPSRLISISKDPLAESEQHLALRYLDLASLQNGSYRIYYELANDNHSHELRTELV